MGEECCVVPPGFRFHPTEEELVGYYLARKVASRKIDLDIIQEVDLYSMEPWDLQRSAIVMCNKQQQYIKQDQLLQQLGGECYYFFSHKDRKYPSGTRTNRATAAGFWKATGRDKPVLSSSSRSSSRGGGGGGGGGGRFVIGMRKTLVFYKGRAPNGRKTEWIMHEYRLHHQSNNHHLPPQEEGWVVCRAFQKPIPNQQQQQQRPPFLLYHHPSGYGDHHFSGSTSSSSMLPLYYPAERKQQTFPQLQLQQLCNTYNYNNDDDIFVESKNKQQHLLSSIINIPQLIESPSCPPAAAVDDAELLLIQHQQGGGGGGQAEAEAAAAGAAIDWNFLDTLLLSSSTDGFAAPPYDPLSSS